MYLFLQNLLSKQAKNVDIPFTDIHAHLLPGIDDGPKDLATALVLVEQLYKIGYKDLIATPHIYWEYYPNTKEIILEKFQLLKSAVKEAAIPIRLGVAAEYFLDDHLERLARNKDLLTLGKTNYVLVECSTLIESMNTASYLFLLQAQGYQPILAHPERYLYYTDEDYQRFLERGCKFQINLLSLAGHYGRPIQKRALSMIKKKWVHFVGTDVHRVEHVEVIDQFLKTALARRIFSEMPLLNKSIDVYEAFAA